MRVAIFVGAFPLISETFILRQITGLLDLGHEVHIFAEMAPPHGSPQHREVAEYGLAARTTYVNMPLATLTEMPVWPISGKTWTAGSQIPLRNAQRLIQALPHFWRCLTRAPRLACEALSGRFGYQAASLSSIYRLSALCRQRWKFDVLHAHFGPMGNNFRLARRLFNAPFIVSFHGYDFTRWPRQEGADCYRELWAAADGVTVNSRFTAGRVRALGCPDDIMHVLPVGLNPDDFAFRERRLSPGETVRVITVARLVPVKGHEYALRAIALTRKLFPDIHYTIVGDGPLRSTLQTLIAELGLGRHVALLGARDNAEVKRLLDDAHIFLLPSARTPEGDEEGQGLVVQEAQACGLPIIATRHGALPEGVPAERAGDLVDEADPDAISRRLVALVEESSRWPEIGRRGRDFVEERFDIRVLNRRLVALYEALADGHSRA